MCFFRKKQKESKVKNVKFNDVETIIKVDKINYIDIVGDFRDPENNPNYSLIGQSRAFRLNKFALNEGKKKGEFYTPKCVVQLITELIEPFSGKIYDPCCGSGGMFVQSIKFIEAHKGNKKNVSIFVKT